MYKTVSKLVPEVDCCHFVLLPSIVDEHVEGLEPFPCRLLDLGHPFLRDVMPYNVLNECPVEMPRLHMLAELVDSQGCLNVLTIHRHLARDQ